jgi:hypothetical protein
LLLLKRSVPVAAVALISLAAVLPAHAAGKVVYQKSTKALQTLTVFKGLLPRHSYRVSVTSPSKHSYVVYGNETYLYVYKGVLGSGTKDLKEEGKTPASFVLKQPYSGDMRQWLLGINVGITRGKGLTVKITDLGTK